MQALPIVLTIEHRMISRFWSHSPISLEHMLFSCLFITTILAIYHSNLGVSD